MIVDSFKHEAEVKEFRKQRRFALLRGIAPQEKRWERLRQLRRPGDPDSFEAFRQQDAIGRGLEGTPHGQQVDRLLKIADSAIGDCVINNKGTIPEFLSELDRFVMRLHYPSVVRKA